VQRGDTIGGDSDGNGNARRARHRDRRRRRPSCSGRRHSVDARREWRDNLASFIVKLELKLVLDTRQHRRAAGLERRNTTPRRTPGTIRCGVTCAAAKGRRECSDRRVVGRSIMTDASAETDVSAAANHGCTHVSDGRVITSGSVQLRHIAHHVDIYHVIVGDSLDSLPAPPTPTAW
jgi:hypothetical protein